MINHSNDSRHRRSIRLQGYDYSQAGAYFVTVCTQNKTCLFGEIVDDEMRLNEMGSTAERCWRAIPKHFHHATLDMFVIMPNHIHGIVLLDDVGARHAVPLRPRFGQSVPGSLSTLMRSYKSAVSKEINAMRNTPGAAVWQRNYYEHIIRDESSLARIREYIENNPLQWALDRENPANVESRGNA